MHSSASCPTPPPPAAHSLLPAHEPTNPPATPLLLLLLLLLSQGMLGKKQLEHVLQRLGLMPESTTLPLAFPEVGGQ